MRRRYSVRIPQRLRSHPILAIRAMKVAPEHPKAHRERSRHCMEKGFFFDRIELKGADITVRDEQLASTIEPDATDPVEPIENHTAMSTSEASQLAAFEAFV